MFRLDFQLQGGDFRHRPRYIFLRQKHLLLRLDRLEAFLFLLHSRNQGYIKARRIQYLLQIHIFALVLLVWLFGKRTKRRLHLHQRVFDPHEIVEIYVPVLGSHTEFEPAVGLVSRRGPALAN